MPVLSQEVLSALDPQATLAEGGGGNPKDASWLGLQDLSQFVIEIGARSQQLPPRAQDIGQRLIHQIGQTLASSVQLTLDLRPTTVGCLGRRV
jgi:hypothetical protein